MNLTIMSQILSMIPRPPNIFFLQKETKEEKPYIQLNNISRVFPIFAFCPPKKRNKITTVTKEDAFVISVGICYKFKDLLAN
jgi:hypothetical protein